MAVRWAVASGNFSNLAIWNDSASLGFPTASDDIWANNNNINIDQSFSAISLNSTARARTIATPAMTANNAPSPYVANASSTNTAFGSGLAWHAFDRSTGTSWATTTPQTPNWISMDFGSGSSIVIDGYTIFGSNSQVNNPRNWTLESSDDNTNWTIRHTVSGAAAITANGSYSIASIGNTTGSRYYRLNVTLGGTGTNLIIPELELYERFTAALASGGSFIFNSGSISGSATSTTAALTAGATNLIQVTAATGSVTLNLSSSVSNPSIASSNLILHSGNCDFNLNGIAFFAGNAANTSVCINKTSAGLITIRGNITGGTTSGINSHGFTSNNGNTIVIGSVNGGNSSSGTSAGINQTTGNVTVTGNVAGGSVQSNNHGISLTGANSILTVTGNVTGGSASTAHGISLTGAASQFTIIGNVTGGTGAGAHGINFTGTSGSVTGTVTGGVGSTAHGINTSGLSIITGNIVGGSGAAAISQNAGNITIIGGVTATSTQGVATNANITISVAGSVTAASTAVGITSLLTGTVLLTGNMLNVAGRQAIFAQNLFISDTTTTQWRLFTPGGQDKTLYSADTFPNQPSSANVRSGSLFGPSNTLSGSMVVPSPSDVRVNVLTDNTVGTGQSLTAADFLAAISASADPYAQRLRNVATVDTVGSLLTGFNNGGF